MPTTNETAEPKTYSRKRRPKGKIPCVAIGRPRITRTRVKPDAFLPKLHDFRAWVPTGKGKEGLVYIASQKTPTETVYEGVTYHLLGIRFNGDLVMGEL
jgi:hypothetical protein